MCWKRLSRTPKSSCIRPNLHRKKINISTVLASQRLGIEKVDDGIWLASFMHYELGYFDLEQKTLQPLDNRFGTLCDFGRLSYCASLGRFREHRRRPD
jgi:hypothetical protein